MREIDIGVKRLHEHLGITLSHLQRNTKLSEGECKAVIDDLEYVKNLSLLKDTTMEEKDVVKSIDELIEEFNISANGSTQLLREMLTTISEGRVPEKTDVTELDQSIDSLRKKYSSISQYVASQVLEEELPVPGSPVTEYVDALENSKIIQYQKQMDEISQTLKSFIAVRSMIDAYTLALQPFQQQAESLLAKIEGTEELDLESIAVENKGPVAFMDAMACDDYDSQENIEILDRVAEFFPPRVCNGLAAKKYYIDQEVFHSIEESEASQDVADITEVLSDSKRSDAKTSETVSDNTEYRNISEDDTIVASVSEDSPEVSANDESNGEEISDGLEEDDSESSEEEAAFVQSLITNGALIDKDESVGIWRKEISASSDKKISASICMNDIRVMNKLALKRIVEYFHKLACLSLEYLEQNGMPTDIAENTLAALQRKGYVSYYEMLTAGRFYVPSKRFKKALGFRDVSKYIGVRKGMMGTDEEEEIEDNGTSVVTRLAFTHLLSETINHFINDRAISSYTEIPILFGDGFAFGIYNSENPKQCLVSLGGFWKDVEECGPVLNTIQLFIKACINIQILLVAGLDTKRAHALADAFLAALDYDFSGTEVVLYSFSDNSYYKYDSHEQIDPSDVFSIEYDDAEELEDTDGEPDAGLEEGAEVKSEEPLETENIEDVEQEKENVIETDSEEKPSSNMAGSASDIAAKDIETGKKPKSTAPLKASSLEVVQDKLYELLKEDEFYAALAYAKANAGFNEDNHKLYKLLAYALNDPMEHCTYSTNNAYNLISKRGMFDDAMIVSVAVRTFFSNQVRYDYQIKPFYDGIKSYPILSQFPSLGNVLYSLMEFKDDVKKGLDAYAGYRVKSQAQLEQKIRKIRSKASDFYDNYVIGRKKENKSQRRFLETKKLMFSATSDLGVYIKSVVDDEREMLPLLEDFLKTEFLKDDENIAEESISADKLWDYIVQFWDQAGESMMYRRHTNLISHLRGNITSITMKAVQMLVTWCVLVEAASEHDEDTGTIAYRKKRGPLLLELDKSIEEIDSICLEEISDDEKAGLRVLRSSLKEIRRCIDGSFDEAERKYYYAPFLLTDDIMLDESFFPDLDIHGADLKVIYPSYRILEHIRKKNEESKNYEDRLNIILDEQGDDYGAAQLIVEYLSDIDSSENYEKQYEVINTGINYAKESAELRKNDFIGELELAQSYGQIDNSEEDKKEKILQIVDEWYEWAVDTSNYGFFKKILASYLSEIRETAKERESALMEELDSFRSIQIPGLTTEAKAKRARRIEKMILEQNYTVAEVLLARASIAEDEHEEVIDEDFLQEFLSNYEDYYKPVATHRSNFSSLVSSRTRNKEERGAKRLADNWLPGGSRLGQDRLTNLLNCFGFKVASVKEQSANSRFESYTVTTAAATGGHRDNYTHPIAAFGSGASQDGFRVVCINGGYDADGLIDLMKQIGDSKHTLILHDYALSLSERRRLARKAKNALGDKFFGVIDRTVMMFLVRNYDETKINRMLISLIMPFGYYQPYVWESANVMPPEIFMGRKHELERIKSPTGVNILYGGRQLGKSALLKKAKEDVDWNENEDRAIYIDIKNADYKKAANKIGHELYDQYILNEDIDTTDWDELSRAIRRRLQDKSKPIPYLLLLLDEADKFIESCEIVNYKPFDALKEIQNIGTNRFKFVIAGLRNIVRFKRELALGNNSVLTHLEPMTVKPFNTTEARELMEIPLHYLGLRFSKEKESLITLILANTNYFPGLIQMYCAKLLEAMRNKDYAGYNEYNTPIYEVSESHIKKILADPEFMSQIREKFFITLSLDEDNYYLVIALIMAYLYHQNGYSDGYSAQDIFDVGNDLDIKKISNLEISKISAFMEELEELNVFRKTDNSHFLFTRFTFFQMMGTGSEVEDKLANFMEA